MKKILFVDEKQYRFSFYYENEDWWVENGIKPFFRAYEQKKDKWLIYLWLLMHRPHAVVFVQLSLKNLILVKLSNMIGVKTIFWQHGVFRYDNQIISKYRKINASLDYLLSFSENDTNQISRYFKNVKNHQLMNHYETSKILNSDKVDNSILYIAQIITKEQIIESSARFPHDENSETMLDNLWEYLSKQDVKVFLKKHPGDRSKYIERLALRHQNFFITENHIVPTLIVGHYSTLIIPYLQLGIPFLQIHHDMNRYIDFACYSPAKELIIQYDENTINEWISQKKDTIMNEGLNNYLSISEIITSIGKLPLL